MSASLTYSSPMTSAIIERTSASTASGSAAACWSRKVGPDNDVVLSLVAPIGRGVGFERVRGGVGGGDERRGDDDPARAGAGGRWRGAVVDPDHAALAEAGHADPLAVGDRDARAVGSGAGGDDRVVA